MAVLNEVLLLFCFAVSSAFFSLAQSPDEQRCTPSRTSCDSSQPYFPEEDHIEINYANTTITEISYNNIYVDFTIFFLDTFTNAENELKYRLVACGCGAPEDTPEERTVIYTDPTNVFVEETPALFMIKEVYGDLSPVRYVSSVTYIYDPTARNLVDAGTIVEAKDSVSNIKFPLLKKEDSMSIFFSSTYNFFDQMKSFGMSYDRPLLPIAEANEVSPLARAEWIKLLALIFNKTASANELFANITSNYGEAKNLASASNRRPSVFFNYPFNYTLKDYNWTLPGSRQYISVMISDANADYRYAFIDTKFDSVQRTLSEILQDFRSSRFLLNSDLYPYPENPSLTKFIQFTGDEEVVNTLKRLHSVRCGEVWSRWRRRNGSANDIFESAITRPDLVLLDYVKILHPDVNAGDHQLYYMEQYSEGDQTDLQCPYVNLIADPPEGFEYVDKQLKITGLDRFAVQDNLEDKVYPKLKENGIEKENVDVQFREPFVSGEDEFILHVRVMTSSENASETVESSAIKDAFEDALTSLPDKSVTVTETGSIIVGEEDEEGGGLSRGAIAGIVIGSLIVLVVIGIILIWRSRKSQFTSPTNYVPVDSPFNE